MPLCTVVEGLQGWKLEEMTKVDIHFHANGKSGTHKKVMTLSGSRARYSFYRY